MKKKNVVIIYTDQLRRDVLGCYGGNEVETPNIDSIAADGILLEECYTPSAVCTPSRGCFMTGLYPHANGAYRNGRPVNRKEHGFAEAFREAGYVTGYLGKWHLSSDTEMGEELEEYNTLGFDDWQYKVEFGHCKSVSVWEKGIKPERKLGTQQSYTTDWLTQETIAFLKRQDRNHPFLFMVSIPDPHQPHEVRPPYDTMFHPCNMEIPESFREQELPDWAERDEWGRNHYFPKNLFDREGHLQRLKAQYLGAVKCIDDNVGKIVNYMKSQDLWENTIVIFTTDHGEYMGEHGLMEKNNLYESVYHLPMVMHLPGMEAKGKKNQTFFNAVDFGITLAGMAGIPYSFPVHGINKARELGCDGKNYVKELYIHPNDVERAGIITDRYELAYVGKGWNGEVFHDHILFDMRKDPLQLNNLYGKEEYEDIKKQLTDKIREHHKYYLTPQEYLPKEVRY